MNDLDSEYQAIFGPPGIDTIPDDCNDPFPFRGQQAKRILDAAKGRVRDADRMARDERKDNGG